MSLSKAQLNLISKASTLLTEGVKLSLSAGSKLSEAAKVIVDLRLSFKNKAGEQDVYGRTDEYRAAYGKILDAAVAQAPAATRARERENLTAALGYHVRAELDRRKLTVKPKKRKAREGNGATRPPTEKQLLGAADTIARMKNANADDAATVLQTFSAAVAGFAEFASANPAKVQTQGARKVIGQSIRQLHVVWAVAGGTADSLQKIVASEAPAAKVAAAK